MTWEVPSQGVTGGHMIHRHDELIHKPARCGHERSTQPEYPPRARRQAESEEVLV
jgi:hypothetical protein